MVKILISTIVATWKTWWSSVRSIFIIVMFVISFSQGCDCCCCHSREKLACFLCAYVILVIFFFFLWFFKGLDITEASRDKLACFSCASCFCLLLYFCFININAASRDKIFCSFDLLLHFFFILWDQNKFAFITPVESK